MRSSATSTTTPIVPKSDSAIVTISSDSFIKDGRKISVGDCALFNPPQDSPPFVGIIRVLIHNKEKNLQLRVNWLYRPGEVKLGEGNILDTAPNELFYSFHKDEIPAASLLHPCRVAFLPKGVQLPLGVSSFVCRRVYDIEKNCVWWLTDRNYEQQEEVNQLLHKTRKEMHATIQSGGGGRSPKPIKSPTSTSQLRPASSDSFSSKGKGKKRERGDQEGSDSVKRERLTKIDDGDHSQSRTENTLKSEIAKFTDKGRLVDSEGVQKFLQLMQSDNAVKKVDLVYRSMLADVIAATDNFDCLTKFIQLRGLPVLYEWLQDVQKEGVCNGSNSKDGDKSIEEFLLLLLRALEKLPINLEALQMCNIGKSVNCLSKHKNLEIQKKAKSLVYIWKKRVEAEMNILDSKSGSNQTISWPSKSRLVESPRGGSRNSVGSGDVTAKASASSSPPDPVKSTSHVSVKDSKTKVKEDAKKVSSSGSKHRKSRNGHKERSSSKQRISAVEKDVPVVEGSNHNQNQRLIVKIPNKGRSPSHSTSAGSSSIMSKQASDKHDLKDKSDAHRAEVNGDISQSTRSNDTEKEQVRADEDIQKGGQVSSKVVESKSRKLHAASFRSINALIDGCVKDLEAAETSISVVDEVGMNLLANVAAGEVSISSVETHIKSKSNPKESSVENLVQDKCPADDEAFESSRKRKVASSSSEEKCGAESSSMEDVHTAANGCMETGVLLASSVDELTMKEDSTVVVAESGIQRRVEDENCVPQDLSVSDQNKLVIEKQPQPHNEEAVHVVAKGEECSSVMVEDNCDTGPKVIFDLNEGFYVDEMVKCEDPVSTTTTTSSVPVRVPVTVVAAAKGGFVPPEDLLINRVEVGWRGSAATSAFRPAEPRRSSTNMNASSSRAPLEFDLNISDEDCANEIRYNQTTSGGGGLGLDLDLNRSDEAMGDMVVVVPTNTITPSSEVRMDFDLNDGPCMDEQVQVQIQEQPSFTHFGGNNMHIQIQPPSLTGLKFSNVEMSGGNLTTPWFTPSYSSTLAIPTILPQQMQHHPFSVIPPQRILGSPIPVSVPVGGAALPFTPDMYRGSVLSSSPAVTVPFQYPVPVPVYPFGSNFVLPSTATFPVGSTSSSGGGGGRLFTPHINHNPQLLGTVDTMSSHYPRPYLVNLTEATTSGGQNSRRWNQQGGFDLNTGHAPPNSSTQAPPTGLTSQMLGVEQGFIYQQHHPMGGSGDGLTTKRKDPDGGDNDTFRYKQHQSSWQ